MRKAQKKLGLQLLRKHYWIFMLLCLVGAFIGSNYSKSLASVAGYYKPFHQLEGLNHEIKTNLNVDLSSVLSKTLSKDLQTRIDRFVSNVSDERESEDQKIFGHSRGILAAVANGLTSNSFLIRIATTISSAIGAANATMMLFTILSGLLMFAFWVFGINIFQVMMARMFLEGSFNKDLPIQRVLFVFAANRWVRTSATMLIRSLFAFLWRFTIVGGVIKRYSYFLVPYIVADNPDIKPLEAITLSRKMMKGHKREAFLLEVSFLGWYLLSLVTLGLLNLFFTNPYKSSTICKYYIGIRNQSIEEGIPQTEWLDTFYPFTETDEVQRKWLKRVHYLRNYSPQSLILMFFAFAFLGWIWEVSLNFITTGSYANRGFLHGPWIPIYGVGGLLILLILKKFRKNPPLEFLSAIVLCGFVEYFTSFALQKVYHEQWWDYSGYFLNLNGRICAEGLLVFGIGAMAIVYVAAPVLDHLIQKLPIKPVIVACVLLVGTFGADVGTSISHPNMGDGITNTK